MPTFPEIIEHTNNYLRVAEIEDWPNALTGLQIENSGKVTKIGAAENPPEGDYGITPTRDSRRPTRNGRRFC